MKDYRKEQESIKQNIENRKQQNLNFIKMINNKTLLTVFITFLNLSIFAQTHNKSELQTKIETILLDKKADVGVAIIGTNNEVIHINGNKMYPMLSTVKFPIALTALYQVEKGKLSMKQKIFIKREELLDDPTNWSPFKEKHPNGNLYITLEEALSWMVSYSDNNLTDIVLRLIGGPEAVQEYMDNEEHFIIKNDEEGMHKDWDSQFVNKTTPNYMVRNLKDFYNGEYLNPKNTKWLYKAMLNNKSGLKRIKGNLPKNTKVAHRTGTSFTNDAGMTGAINDVGIIKLPNGKQFYIGVFVHNTYETFADSEKIIADIAKTAYDFYATK